MDLLDLTEVAELLGEPETMILAACERFPEHVPTVGLGSERRFPSVALDVLRLITDAIAAGAPFEATTHLLATHFPPVTSPEPEPGPSAPARETTQPPTQDPSLDDIVASVLHRQESLLRETVKREVSAALTPIHVAIDEVQRAISDLRAEMSAQHALNTDRTQVDNLAAAVANLRAGIQGIASSAQRSIEPLRPVVVAAAEHRMPHAHPPITNTDERQDVNQSEPANPSSTNGTTSTPSDDEPSGIITRFASRTPRRMGRTLFADEV